MEAPLVRDLILVDMSDIFLSAGHISVLLGSVSFSQTTYLSRLVSIVCGRICDISTFRLIFRTFSYNLNINQLRALGWIFDFSSNSECQNSKSQFTFCSSEKNAPSPSFWCAGSSNRFTELGERSKNVFHMGPCKIWKV